MKNLYQKIEDLNPEQDPIYTAVEKINNNYQIKRFINEYVRKQDSNLEDSLEMARRKIRDAVLRTDARDSDRWMRTAFTIKP